VRRWVELSRQELYEKIRSQPALSLPGVRNQRSRSGKDLRASRNPASAARL